MMADYLDVRTVSLFGGHYVITIAAGGRNNHSDAPDVGAEIRIVRTRNGHRVPQVWVTSGVYVIKFNVRALGLVVEYLHTMDIEGRWLTVTCGACELAVPNGQDLLEALSRLEKTWKRSQSK